MKLKKTVNILILIIALLSFTQSAFANGASPISWSLTDYASNPACSQLTRSSTDDYSAYLYVTSSWPGGCDLEWQGTTQVSNINQLFVDWTKDSWDSGIGYAYVTVIYDGIYDTYDLNANSNGYDSGTIVANLNGYSGPVEIRLNCSSGGGRRVDASINVWW